MNVLAIETSGKIGGVAVVRDGEVVVEVSFQKGMAHGRMLVQRLADVCDKAGLRPNADVDVVAVSQGPGSFTGLRVGIACAKTLAFASGAKVVGVCSFDALARNAPQEAQTVCTCLDAKRGDVYFGVYRREGDDLERVAGPDIGKPGDVVASLARPAWVLGDAVDFHPDAFDADGIHAAPEAVWAVRPGVVGLLGEQLARRGEVADAASLAPIYLRRPEAEEKRLAREG